jgi:hypothetical protein
LRTAFRNEETKLLEDELLELQKVVFMDVIEKNVAIDHEVGNNQNPEVISNVKDKHLQVDMIKEDYKFCLSMDYTAGLNPVKLSVDNNQKEGALVALKTMNEKITASTKKKRTTVKSKKNNLIL